MSIYPRMEILSEGKKSPELEWVIVGHPRLPHDLLNQRPVDMLAFESGYATQPPTSYE
jgi:hypothetical protein